MKIEVFAIIVLLFSNPVFAQPRFENKHADLLQAYVNKFGLPELDDDKARDWTRELAEQFVFSFPNEGWGHKSGGGSRPPSTDVIARQCCGGFWGYDLILNQGIPSQSLIPRPGVLNLAGQAFITVSPVNHLGSSTTVPPVVIPPITQPPVNLTPILERLSVLEKQVSEQLNLISNLTTKIAQLDSNHISLVEFTHKTFGDFGLQINSIGSRPIPVGCNARFLGRSVGCNLVFP